MCARTGESATSKSLKGASKAMKELQAVVAALLRAQSAGGGAAGAGASTRSDPGGGGAVVEGAGWVAGPAPNVLWLVLWARGSCASGSCGKEGFNNACGCCSEVAGGVQGCPGVHCIVLVVR